MSIAYGYEVIKSDINSRSMEVVYSSEGRVSQHIGMRLPFSGEPIESVIHAYAPVQFWAEQDSQMIDVPVGTVGSFSPPGAAPVTIESARAAKSAEVSEWRYRLETRGVSVGGVLIRTDRESQAQITGAYTCLKEGLVTAIDWKAATGDFYSLTLVDIAPIAQAVAQHVQSSFTQERQLLSLVAAATTIAAIQSITLPAIDPANTIPVTGA